MGKKHASQYANFGWLQNRFRPVQYLPVSLILKMTNKNNYDDTANRT